jgi:hypothetical protein
MTTYHNQLTETFGRLSPSLGHKISYYLLNYWQLSSSPCKIGISWGQNGGFTSDFLLLQTPFGNAHLSEITSRPVGLTYVSLTSSWHAADGKRYMLLGLGYDIWQVGRCLSTWVWTKTLYPSSSHQNKVLIHSHIVDEHGWMIVKYLPSGELR